MTDTLDQVIVTEATVLYYTTINGKCAWCGIDAFELPRSHFEEHEEEEKRNLTIK